MLEAALEHVGHAADAAELQPEVRRSIAVSRDESGGAASYEGMLSLFSGVGAGLGGPKAVNGILFALTLLGVSMVMIVVTVVTAALGSNRRRADKGRRP